MVTAIMMLYKNIVQEVLQGDILARYEFIICLDYVLQTLKYLIKIYFIFKKTQCKRYPAKTITDADYTNDLALLCIYTCPI